MEFMTVYEIAAERLFVINGAVDVSRKLRETPFFDDEKELLLRLLMRTVEEVFLPDDECPVPSCPANETPRTSGEDHPYKGILHGNTEAK